jgi:TetR/AcrR family transcriptional repressor of nem operon
MIILTVQERSFSPNMSDEILSLKEQAEDLSMHLFWQQGYFNTSIDELVKVSGLSRAAIYKHFGGKEGLFVMMLQRYREYLTRHFFVPLQSGQGIEAIFAFFDQFIELSKQGKLQHGCFFIATASEIPSHQNAIKAVINAFLEELSSLFCRALDYGKEHNQLSHSLDSEAVSSFLVANVFGLFTLARAVNNTDWLSNQVTMIKQFLGAYQISF